MPTALLPESILLMTALLVLGLGVSAPGARTGAAALTLVGGFLAAAALVFFPVDGNFLGGMVALDPLARLFKLVILGLGLAAVVFAYESFPAAHFAESLALVLFSVIGMMLLAGTEDLLMIFIALELTSIPLYVLAAFDRERPASAEAGLKSQRALDAADTALIAQGRKAIAGDYDCANCHKFHEKGKLGAGPDLTGYSSREWLVGIISNPAHKRFYGAKNDRMPLYAESADPEKNILSTQSIEILADWLRGEWR